MRIFGFDISRVKAAVPVTAWPLPSNSWLGAILEARSGNWQRGIVVDNQEVRKQSTVWACQTLIASDIGKLGVGVIEKQADGIWESAENSAYSPVLRKPNHYQNRIKFFEQWMLSKLGPAGNTYILKERDGSRKVRKLYLLDPTKVHVLVAVDGSVYYELTTDHLSGIMEATTRVPASEIIHDVGIALYHPLCGLSPIVACGLAATQSLKIQEQSAKFFENNSKPGGVLTAPATISNETAARIQKHWDANFAGEENAGRVAVLGDGLKYEAMAVKAVDAQLVEQLKLTDEQICAVHHVPGFMVGVGQMPANNIVEHLYQQYYSQCLQSHIESIELCLDEGLEMPSDVGVEFDIDALIRMDSATRMKNAESAMKSGMKVDEVRRRYHGLGKVEGGDAVYLQQQNYSTAALAKRDAREDPFAGVGFGDALAGDQQQGLSAIEQIKARADAYGVAVRAGAVTPQRADEADFRGELGLPAMSDDVNSAWADDEGIRRPITLRDPNAAPSPFTPGPPSENDDKSMTLRVRARLATHMSALAIQHAEAEPRRAA